MSNSPLVVYTKLSPNHSGKRTKKIDAITIHCMAGNCSVETCGNLFASSSRQASSNYGIGTDGRIALYVDEANRSWCTSSNANDQRAVTIEVANNGGAPDWPVSAKAYAALLDLVTDICKRNGIKRLVWSTSKNDRVNHLNGCNMTVHRDYANKSCPGDYLYNRHGQIAAEVNKRLGVTDAGGSTGDQTSGNTETGLKVGDMVDFKGTQHYTSAAAKDAKTCKPGKATITALGVIETAEQDGENIDQPADPAGPGRQQPDDACAGFPDIEPMDAEEAEEDAQQQRHRLAFRRRRPLRCGDADRALLRARLPAGARRI